ncbi:hypothetical protein PTKIN_Ptkin04bG0019100 [Pterospermum kingtungense]
MATVLAKSTTVPALVTSPSPLSSKEFGKSKPSTVRMIPSLPILPALTITTFGLRALTSSYRMVGFGQDFDFGFGKDFSSKVATSISSRRGTASIGVTNAISERFTGEGVKVFELAEEEARRLGHDHVGTEEILLGLIGEDNGIATKVLKSMGINLKDAREEVEMISGRGNCSVIAQIPFSIGAIRVLELSLEEAQQCGHNYIGSEHILLGLLWQEQGLAIFVLENLGVDANNVRRQVLRMIGDKYGTSLTQDNKVSVVPRGSILEEYGTDLTKQAEEGKLNPVVGRHAQIELVVEILGRRSKNNPCLIGEPGVGKSAIAEALAQIIVTGAAPDTIKGKKVITLDISRLLAGTKHRAGAVDGGAIDAANILKPALARGELQCIGATTFNEYRKYIEKDPALERRFQPVTVPAPSVDETIQILEGLQEPYENHHKVRYADEALIAAAQLSDQYISNRFLPDKAIDLIDQAGSRVRLRHAQKSKELEKELRELKNGLGELVKELRQITKSMNEAIRSQDFVVGLFHGLNDLFFHKIVSSWTGVPVEKISADESDRLLKMEETLCKRVIGQDGAVHAISHAIRCARLGLKDPNRPIGSFIFSGLPGVGKTELAKALADYYFGSEQAMILIDMSELNKGHTVSKLIGSPPGYVGYEEGGQLTEAVRRRPYSVVLLDEIDKADTDVHNLLLQILDDGRLTDSKGRTVDFKNTLLIMTSNIGSSVIEGFARDYDDKDINYNHMQSLVREEHKKYYKPEFLDRLDEIIVFRRLTKLEFMEIADMMIKEIVDRFKAIKIELMVTETFREKVVDEACRQGYGARRLRRLITTKILDKDFVMKIIRDNKEGDSVMVDVDSTGHVVFLIGESGVPSLVIRLSLTVMAKVVAKSTIVPALVTSPSPAQHRKSKSCVNLMCSLKTPALRLRGLSELRAFSSSDSMVFGFGHHFQSFSGFSVSVTSQRGRGSRCVAPKAMFEHFTEKSIKIIMLAQEEARRSGHNFVGTEQILLGLIGEGTCVAAEVLKSMGINLEDARAEVEKIIGRGSGFLAVEIPFTPRAKSVLEFTFEEARKLGHNYIGSGHLLLGLIEGKGVAINVLEDLGADLSNIRKEVIHMLGKEVSAVPGILTCDTNTPTLDAYGTNLTMLAEEGKLDPVIGRQAQIERVIKILNKRTKNNPCLVGEPGVGKTAIAKGLAQRIANGDVPHKMKGKKVIALDMGLLAAQTKHRGEFWERWKNLMKEIKQSGQIILFIDEVHNLIGAGAAEGAIDASSIWKPALARGEFQCIGATTLDEYRKHIEKDPSLESRFQPVEVPEPSVDETVQILKGLREHYELYHKVRYTDEALISAAQLSYQYISGRSLPDKAIDLIDEAGSHVSVGLHHAQLPNQFRELERQFVLIIMSKNEAVQNQNFKKAGELYDREIELRAQIEEMNKAGNGVPVLTEVDIQHIVSSRTGIPVEKLSTNESDRLLKMEETLHKRVIGQDEAVKAISHAIQRARVGLKNPNRPIASFIFLGPTGVGKSELAKALAAHYFGSEEAMIRLDMSQFMERHTVSELTDQLTEAVRRRPYTVVLFDKIEKAHADAVNLLLQILEDGRLTDTQGRSIDFKNTLLTMTSNIGVDHDKDMSYNRIESLMSEELKQYFKPEFLNRLDKIIVFRQLTKLELKEIADTMLKEVFDTLKASRKIDVEVTERFKQRVVEEGYNPSYGARALISAITNLVVKTLADKILAREIKEGDSVTGDVDSDGNVVFLIGNSGGGPFNLNDIICI